jgi:sugar lactone lactonase YvrE
VSVEGIITNFAGNGSEGFSGDGGLATRARLNQPNGLAADAAGNLYIADSDSHRVRKVTVDGMITTVAGRGPTDQNRKGPGVPGDGGLATEAMLYGPIGIAVDREGNLFIADWGDLHLVPGGGARVRKVDSKGIITTVAGTGEPGYSGDGGLATEAQFNSAIGVAVDTAGNLFIADWGNYRVRKVDAQGIITTVAGMGKAPYSGEGGPATATGLRGSVGPAVDAAGNLFFSDSGLGRDDGLGDNERVLKVYGVAAPGLIAGLPFPKP